MSKVSQKFFKTAGGPLATDSGEAIACNKKVIFSVGAITNGTTPPIDFEGMEVVVTSNTNNRQAFVAGLDNCGNQIFFKIAGGNSGLEESIAKAVVANDNYAFVTGSISEEVTTDFNRKGIFRMDTYPVLNECASFP